MIAIINNTNETIILNYGRIYIRLYFIIKFLCYLNFLKGMPKTGQAKYFCHANLS